MMKGLSPPFSVGARKALKSGTSSPTHLPFLSGALLAASGSHQMSFFRSLQGLPAGSAAVRRPREAPPVGEVVLLVGGLALVRLVDELAVRRLVDDARVDPAPARRLPVVGHVGEGAEGLALLVLDLPILVGDLRGGVAVDLLQHELHVRLFWVVPVVLTLCDGALVT